jgi:hypothetical protein
MTPLRAIIEKKQDVITCKVLKNAQQLRMN